MTTPNVTDLDDPIELLKRVIDRTARDIPPAFILAYHVMSCLALRAASRTYPAYRRKAISFAHQIYLEARDAQSRIDAAALVSTDNEVWRRYPPLVPETVDEASVILRICQPDRGSRYTEWLSHYERAARDYSHVAEVNEAQKIRAQREARKATRKIEQYQQLLGYSSNADH